jgi:ribosome-interacting GTPase 1
MTWRRTTSFAVTRPGSCKIALICHPRTSGSRLMGTLGTFVHSLTATLGPATLTIVAKSLHN